MKSAIVRCFLFFLIVTPVSAQAIIYLEADGTGDYPTIQAAIDASEPYEQIRLRSGIYRGPGNRDLVFNGKTAWIHGYADDPADVIIDCEGSPAEPHRAAVYDQPRAQVALSSVTIRGGYHTEGGALLIMGQDYGPISCIFEDNHAERGGAIYVDGAEWFEATLCTFRNNSADAAGGAVYTRGVSYALMRTVEATGNSAARGGVVYTESTGGAADAYFYEMLVSGNSATIDGGVAWVSGASAIDARGGTRFLGNDGGAGSVLAVPDGLARLGYSTFRANVAAVGSACITADRLEAIMLMVTDTAGGSAVSCNEATVTSSNLWRNAGGDWTGVLTSLIGQDGNLMTDPCYCVDDIVDVGLCADSPCILVPGPGAIGATYGADCADCACGVVATEKANWGGVRAMYR